MPLPLPAEPGWAFWPADLSKHIPSAPWSSSDSSLTLCEMIPAPFKELGAGDPTAGDRGTLCQR